MDDILLNKAATLETCVKRIREEYIGHEDSLLLDYTRQDSIILNLQRACETAIDMGTHMVRIKRLGLPQSSRDIFVLLEKGGLITTELSKRLQAMVGFRNIAIHNYQELNLHIVK